MAQIIMVPISTLLVLAGIILIVSSTVLEIRVNIWGKTKSIDAARPSKLNITGIILGILMTGTGIVVSYLPPVVQEKTPSTPIATIGMAALTAIAPSPVVIPPVFPSMYPTIMPVVTKTPTPLPALTLQDGCISATNWQAISHESLGLANNLNTKGCLSLDSAGIIVDDSGVLHIFKSTKNPLVAGIYTSIPKNSSLIEFNLLVKDFSIAYDTPSAINFAITLRKDPLGSLYASRFRLFVDKAINNPLIFFVLADLGETNGTKITGQQCEYDHIYNIKLKIDGVKIHVYINDVKMHDQLSLPPGEKVFLIAYDLFSQTSVDIKINNIRVDGVYK